MLHILSEVNNKNKKLLKFKIYLNGGLSMHIALLSNSVLLAATPPTRYPFPSLTGSRIKRNTLPKPPSVKAPTPPPPSNTISPGSQNATENALLGVSPVVLSYCQLQDKYL